MAHTHNLQQSQHMNFGQKMVNAAGTLKSIYDIGSTIYKVGRIAAPIISALL